MNNLIKMNFYRLIHSTCTWVILALAIFFAVISAALMKSDKELMEAEAYLVETETYTDDDGNVVTDENTEEISLGISVDTPYEHDGFIPSVMDYVASDVTSGMVQLFAMIFTVLFINAEVSSGYIKNIARAKNGKFKPVLAKLMVAIIYTVFLNLAYIGASLISVKLIIGPEKWGLGKEAAIFMAGLILIQMAISSFIGLITVISKSSVIGITVGCFELCGVTYVLAGLINKVIDSSRIDISRYMITPNINSLSLSMGSDDIIRVLAVETVWILVCVMTSVILTQKRDIV